VSDSTIILCGGSINQREIPLAMQTSNAMIPVNGRPVIGWILNDLLRKCIGNVVIVTRTEDTMLHRFLERCYADRLELKIARLYQPGSILDSLNTGLQASSTAGQVRLVLGDTLITDSYDSDEDFIYTGPIDYADRWCLVNTDTENIVVEYIDKRSSADPALDAIAGYYHFTDGHLLLECTEKAIAAGCRELSDVLKMYGQTRDIHARGVEEWFDFGHVDKLAEARHRLLSSRSFNALQYDPVLQTVTKTSSHNDKLADELQWYLSIPDELQVLAPRILQHEESEGRVTFTQEFYGYSSLAELYVFGDLSEDIWLSIIGKTLGVHQHLSSFKGPVSRGAMLEMYFGKTQTRLDQLTNSTSEWQQLLKAETIEFNGQSLTNLPALMPQIETHCQRLAETGTGAIVHGDLCFSNILFDLPHQIVRLVDPRGSFGSPGIYGDPRYDVAKLRHSVCGLYDFIVSDMFSVSQSGTSFQARVHALNPLDLTERFDSMISDLGYEPGEIRFIEGLLFASMLPLHADQPDRQKMMYCRSLELLNSVLDDRGFRFDSWDGISEQHLLQLAREK
jgi:dTDP-glucose pyrophosphorylase